MIYAKDILNIWVKTILIGSFLPGLFFISGGIASVFGVTLAFIIPSFVGSSPLLIYLWTKSKLGLETEVIYRLYFIGVLITLLLLSPLIIHAPAILLILIYFLVITLFISHIRFRQIKSQ